MVRKRSAITQADIATQCGVSQSLVSAVLTGRDAASQRCAPELRQRILDLAREQRYLPSRAARRLREGRAGTIGVLVPELSVLPQGAFSALSARLRSDRRTILLECVRQQTWTTALRMAQDVCECTVVFNAEHLAPLLGEYRRLGHPCLAVNSPTVWASAIDFDDRGAAHAVAVACRTHGRERALYVGGTGLDNGYALPRIEALIAAGMQVEGVWDAPTAQLLSRLRSLLVGPAAPNLVLLHHTIYAPLVYQAAQATGRHVGDDLTVIGFQANPVSSFLVPACPVFAIDGTQLAERIRARVAVLLAGQDDGRRESHPYLLEPRRALPRWLLSVADQTS